MTPRMSEVTNANNSPPHCSSQQKRQKAGSGDVDFQQTVFHTAASDSDRAMNEILRSWVSETDRMLQEAQSILVRTEACLDKATIVTVNLEVLVGAVEATQQSV